MNAELHFELTDALVRRGVLRYILRRWRVQIGCLAGFVGLFLFTFVLAVVPTAVEEARREPATLWVMAPWALALPAIGVLVIAWLYWALVRGITSQLRRLPGRRMTWRVSDDGVEMHGPLGRSHYPWTMFDGLWRSRDVWLLPVSRSEFHMVPTSVLDPQVADFVIAKVREHGGKVL